MILLLSLSPLDWSLRALFYELLKKPAQGRQVGKQGLKGIPIQGENVNASKTPDCGHAEVVANQGHFPKALSRAKMGNDGLLRSFRIRYDHFDLAIH